MASPKKPPAVSAEPVPEGAPGFWPHQLATLGFLRSTNASFDFSSPGTGKTRAHVHHYATRPKAGRKRLLILCPKTLMVSAWGKDIERFAPSLTVSYAFADQRMEAFKMKTDVVIMNHDGVKLFKDKAMRRILFDFDHLIVDESTAFKNAQAQRTKFLMSIAKMFEYRELLTGTPNPNTVMELWAPAMIIDGGKRLGNSYYHLRSKVQIPTQIGPDARKHLRWDDTPGAGQAVNELLSDITIRHAFEDVMTHVPANHRHTKTFDLSPKARKIYDKMEADAIAELDQGVVSAVHAAAMRTKLLQIASGAVYGGTGEDGYALVDTQRYELIVDLTEEVEHSIVFFNWKHQRDLLAKTLDARKLSYAIIDGNVTARGAREKIVADYQAGKYHTILLHPRTGAHGLTLTRGTRTIVSSPFYEADLMEQGIARIVRGEQDKLTDTVFVQAAGTVEALVYERLNDKTFNMKDLLQMMKERKK